MDDRRATPAVLGAYDALLASIGDRAPDIGERRLVTHAPHVGSGYRGLVILGQALSGWADVWSASVLATPGGRREVIAATFARNADAAEPMEWLLSSGRLGTPWWKAARLLAEALEPDSPAPWHGRFAWVNLYPAAPIAPDENPRGPLREAQDPHVVPLLLAELEALEARTVVALVGREWWPAGTHPAFAHLEERPRPFTRSGRAAGCRWVVGWHPGGASRRRMGPHVYVPMVLAELGRVSK